ncbi:MAG: hypothetical protein AAF337_06245, partial [Pseudomonadota bacterium]
MAVALFLLSLVCAVLAVSVIALQRQLRALKADLASPPRMLSLLEAGMPLPKLLAQDGRNKPVPMGSTAGVPSLLLFQPGAHEDADPLLPAARVLAKREGLFFQKIVPASQKPSMGSERANHHGDQVYLPDGDFSTIAIGALPVAVFTNRDGVILATDSIKKRAHLETLA